MKFTEYDKAIMIGLILGDGYISPKGRINVTHCEQQKSILNIKLSYYIQLLEVKI